MKLIERLGGCLVEFDSGARAVVVGSSREGYMRIRLTRLADDQGEYRVGQILDADVSLLLGSKLLEEPPRR